MKPRHTEQAAIGSLISGGWSHGGFKLEPRDFVTAKYRKIFSCIAEMEAAGDQVDIFTVTDRSGCDLEEFKAGASARAQGPGTALWWHDLGTRENNEDWVKTGFPDVDHRLGGMRGGDLIILAGRPAMGKTALALNIAMQSKRKTAIFSLEMQADGLIDRMAASLTGVDLRSIRMGELDAEQWSALASFSGVVQDLPIHLDDRGGLTIEEIHARARSIKARSGLELVVVDYLQLIRGGDATYERVTHISQQAKRMAKDLDVPVLMLAQLSRRCEERTDKRPIASDLRDSGSIEQDADVIAFIYRDEVYNPTSPMKGYAELIFRKTYSRS